MIDRRQLLLGAALAASTGTGRTQPRYPARPIRFVLPAAPASAVDLTVRALAEQMRQMSGQPVHVDNKPGASGLIAIQEVLRAPPDGYTVLAGNVNSNGLLPALQPGKVRVDLRKALIPVTMMTDAPVLFLSTKTGFPPETLRDVIDYARARPGQLFYTSSGIGTHSHFSMLVLSGAANLRASHVPVTSNAQAIAVMGSGEVQLGFATLATILPLVQEGRFRALAVTGGQRSPALPNIPTFGEAGYPMISTGVWQGLFLPAGTPDDVVQSLFRFTTQAMADPGVKASFERHSLQYTPSASPREFAAFVDAEIRKYAEIAVANNLPIE